MGVTPRAATECRERRASSRSGNVLRRAPDLNATIMAILCNALHREAQCRISDLTVCGSCSARGTCRPTPLEARRRRKGSGEKFNGIKVIAALDRCRAVRTWTCDLLRAILTIH